jgi:hypothetical protein
MAGKSETACKLTNSVPIVAVYIATSLSPCTQWISTSFAATDVFRGYGVAIPASFFRNRYSLDAHPPFCIMPPLYTPYRGAIINQAVNHPPIVLSG